MPNPLPDQSDCSCDYDGVRLCDSLPAERCRERNATWESCPDCDGEPMGQYLPTGETGCAACSNRGGFAIPASAFHAASDEQSAKTEGS